MPGPISHRWLSHCLCGEFPLTYNDAKIDFIAAGGKIHTASSCEPAAIDSNKPLGAVLVVTARTVPPEYSETLNLLQSIDNKLARVLSALEAPHV